MSSPTSFLSQYPSASQRLPPIVRPFVSVEASRLLDVVERFVEERCIPAGLVYEQQLGDGYLNRFNSQPPIMEQLKAEARELGLWNLWLPKNLFAKDGAQFSNLEYGLMAEILGKSTIASEATNCAAPDTGNMEVLAKYGTADQKKEWLEPLLQGKIRSAFLMTEPQVSSSDATNIELSIKRDGDHYVLNGQKWWSGGSGDSRCRLYIVAGKSDPTNPDPYKQQSIILVSADTSGLTVKRMLSVMGYDAAPHGHGHILCNNVRVHKRNLVLGEGRGFEVMQGRLGPGRIHHAMRCIGNAERALEYFVARLHDPTRKPFGEQLAKHGIMLERVARSRAEIDTVRLAVLNAAIKIDQTSAKSAVKEVAEVKILAPSLVQKVADWAMQAYGGAGLSQETPLPEIWTAGRIMRIADGPDEVHMIQLGRNEAKRGLMMLQKIKAQGDVAREILAAFGSELKDPLELNRQAGIRQSSKL